MWFFSPLPFFTYFSMMSSYTSVVWGIPNNLANPGPWNGLGKLDTSLTPQLLAAWGPLGKAWCGNLPSLSPWVGRLCPYFLTCRVPSHNSSAQRPPGYSSPTPPAPSEGDNPQHIIILRAPQSSSLFKLFCLLVSLFTVTLSPVEISAL